ncbi:MAG: hypothetical protein EXS27_09665 [Pedosphaera sp.]|nr:hypothetical protein [Pedosphaera sp.]
MQPNWAEENLQVIRTIMERAALYRRTLAPLMLATGLIGIVASGIGLLTPIQTPLTFLALWLITATLAMGVSLIIVRRQAVMAREPFSTPASRRVIGALYAPLCAGALLALPAVVLLGTGRPAPAESVLTGVMCVWMGFYGCGLNAAGQYSSRGVRLLGWGFIGTGPLLATLYVGGFLIPELGSRVLWTNPHAIMGTTFGGFHLVAAGYLYLTESRPPSP